MAAAPLLWRFCGGAPQPAGLTHPATALMIPTLSATTTPATAKTPDCKVLTKAACQREPACVWVDPYKRLDEVKVKGFCRATTATPAKPEGN